MLFGADAFSELPISTTQGTRAEISVGATPMTLAIGNYSIQTSNIIENVGSNALSLSSTLASVVTNVSIAATATPLVMTSTLATASGSAVINIGNNPLTLSTTDATATGGAVASPGATALTLTTTEAGVIVWNPIIPGPTNVWKEIKPYGGTP
jgi:hypothetical protein